jgi:hypothetical protein
MFLGKSLKVLFPLRRMRRRGGNLPQPAQFRPAFECLEDRRLLTSMPAIFQDNLVLPANLPATAGVSQVLVPSLVVQQNVPFAARVAELEYTGASSITNVAISWGDGSASVGYDKQLSSDLFDEFGSHRYATAGVFQITVRIDLANQISVLAVGSALVIPPISPEGSPLSASAASTGEVTFFQAYVQMPPAQNHGESGSSGPSDHGSPAASFRAILFSQSANTPIAPAGPTLIAISGGEGRTSDGLHFTNGLRPSGFEDSGSQGDALGRTEILESHGPMQAIRSRATTAASAELQAEPASIPRATAVSDSHLANLSLLLVAKSEPHDPMLDGLPDAELERLTFLGSASLVIASQFSSVKAFESGTEKSGLSTHTGNLIAELIMLVGCLLLGPGKAPPARGAIMKCGNR